METVLAQDRCLVCEEGVAHYEGNGDDPQTCLLEVDEAFALQCYIHRDCAARTLPLLAREVQKAMRLLGIEDAVNGAVVVRAGRKPEVLLAALWLRTNSNQGQGDPPLTIAFIERIGSSAAWAAGAS